MSKLQLITLLLGLYSAQRWPWLFALFDKLLAINGSKLCSNAELELLSLLRISGELQVESV
jgi:hypothetical protein